MPAAYQFPPHPLCPFLGHPLQKRARLCYDDESRDMHYTPEVASDHARRLKHSESVDRNVEACKKSRTGRGTAGSSDTSDLELTPRTQGMLSGKGHKSTASHSSKEASTPSGESEKGKDWTPTTFNEPNFKRSKMGKQVPKCILETPQGRKFLNTVSSQCGPRVSGMHESVTLGVKIPVTVGCDFADAPGLDYPKKKYDFSAVPEFEGFSMDLQASFVLPSISSAILHHLQEEMCDLLAEAKKRKPCENTSHEDSCKPYYDKQFIEQCLKQGQLTGHMIRTNDKNQHLQGILLFVADSSLNQEEKEELSKFLASRGVLGDQNDQVKDETGKDLEFGKIAEILLISGFGCCDFLLQMFLEEIQSRNEHSFVVVKALDTLKSILEPAGFITVSTKSSSGNLHEGSSVEPGGGSEKLLGDYSLMVFEVQSSRAATKFLNVAGGIYTNLGKHVPVFVQEIDSETHHSSADGRLKQGIYGPSASPEELSCVREHLEILASQKYLDKSVPVQRLFKDGEDLEAPKRRLDFASPRDSPAQHANRRARAKPASANPKQAALLVTSSPRMLRKSRLRCLLQTVSGSAKKFNKAGTHASADSHVLKDKLKSSRMLYQKFFKDKSRCVSATSGLAKIDPSKVAAMDPLKRETVRMVCYDLGIPINRKVPLLKMQVQKTRSQLLLSLMRLHDKDVFSWIYSEQLTPETLDAISLDYGASFSRDDARSKLYHIMRNVDRSKPENVKKKGSDSLGETMEKSSQGCSSKSSRREESIESKPDESGPLKPIPWQMIVCRVCGSGDRDDQLVLCDRCNDGYHMDCLQPKLKTLPEGEWLCPECLKKDARKTKGTGLARAAKDFFLVRSLCKQTIRLICHDLGLDEKGSKSEIRQRITSALPDVAVPTLPSLKLPALEAICVDLGLAKKGSKDEIRHRIEQHFFHRDDVVEDAHSSATSLQLKSEMVVEDSEQERPSEAEQQERKMLKLSKSTLQTICLNLGLEAGGKKALLVKRITEVGHGFRWITSHPIKLSTMELIAEDLEISKKGTKDEVRTRILQHWSRNNKAPAPDAQQVMAKAEDRASEETACERQTNDMSSGSSGSQLEQAAKEGEGHKRMLVSVFEALPVPSEDFSLEPHLLLQAVRSMEADAAQPTEVADPWEYVACKKCGLSEGDERMILCDGCDDAYHVECTWPRLSQVPEGEWFCKTCRKLHDAAPVQAKERQEQESAEGGRERSKVSGRVRVQTQPFKVPRGKQSK